MKKWSFFLLMSAMVLLLQSCQKETQITPAPEPGPPPAPFSKTLTLADGLSEVTIRVSSNDAVLLETIDAGNFEFSAMTEIPDTNRAEEAPTGMQAPASEPASSTLVIELIDAKFQPEVKGLGLQYKKGDGPEERNSVDLWYSSEGWLLGIQGIMALGLPFYVEGWYSGNDKLREPGWRVFTINMDWWAPTLWLHITEATLLQPLVLYLP